MQAICMGKHYSLQQGKLQNNHVFLVSGCSMMILKKFFFHRHFLGGDGVLWSGSRGQGLGFLRQAYFTNRNSYFLILGLGVSPKLKIFLGVPHKIWKKVVVLPGAEKGFCLRREAAPAVERVGGMASVRFLRFFWGGEHLAGCMSCKSNESNESFKSFK